MNILRVISHLLNYPTEDLQQHTAEIKGLIGDATEISPDMRLQLSTLLDSIYQQDLLDAQEAYTSLFDRGRALSLLLFEHVHGESRDRGQAMVDLMALYEKSGFYINVKELPDYIPLYLEYLAHRPELEAREGLADVAHILGMLSARLEQRESLYASLFDALLIISGAKVDSSHLREIAANEERDDTPEALDKVWEEEAITFGVGDAHNSAPQTSCATTANTPFNETLQTKPVQWVEATAVNKG